MLLVLYQGIRVCKWGGKEAVHDMYLKLSYTPYCQYMYCTVPVHCLLSDQNVASQPFLFVTVFSQNEVSWLAFKALCISWVKGFLVKTALVLLQASVI